LKKIKEFITVFLLNNAWKFSKAVAKLVEKIPQKYSTDALALALGSALVAVFSVLYEELFRLFEEVSIQVYIHSSYWFLLLSPLCFWLSFYLIKKFAKYANGSGIPQLLAAIELSNTPQSHLIDKILGFRIVVFKFISSFVLLLGGGSIGREGPTLQIAGSVFKLVYDWFPKAKAKITYNAILITGGASGLAAAFNTPIGGIVYVVEELSKSHINKLRTPVFTAVIIAGFTAQLFTGSYLFLGFPKTLSLPFNLFYLAVLVSLAGGLAGGVFTRMIFILLKIKSKIKNQHLFIIILGFLFAFLVIFTGKESLGTGKPLINHILFENTENLKWFHFPGRFFGSLLSFGSGGAGGIFATSLASGASLGHLIMSFFEIKREFYNLLILMCMIAFLTGVTRTPFTSAVLVLEMTDRHSAIFFFLMAAVFAQFASEKIQRTPIYEILKNRVILDLNKD
jgi:H+/Cl- antiporter ClcA